MNPDLRWFIGRRIKEVEAKDYSWFFVLDDGSNIATESMWRMITTEGVVVSSEDHEQTFGLSAPVDAGNLVKTKIGLNTIDQYELDPMTGDLSLLFNDNTKIEFLNLSSGYESWRIIHGTQEIVCMGGGKLTEINSSVNRE